MTTLEEALDAAMVADPDGGPWETALADALEAALSLADYHGATAVLEEYRAAVRMRAEEQR